MELRRNNTSIVRRGEHPWSAKSCAALCLLLTRRTMTSPTAEIQNFRRA